MRRLWAVLLLAASAIPASGAVVYLKDGSRVKGTIVGATAMDLTVLLPEGTLTISSDRIARVDYSDSSEVPPPPSMPTPPPPAAPPPEPAEEPEARDHKQLISPAFGFAVPLSNVNVAGQSIPNGYAGGLTGVQYLYFFNDRLAAGADFTYFNRSPTDAQAFLPNTVAHVGGDTTLLMAVLRYELRDSGRVRPFILAGAGGGYSTLRIDARPVSGATWLDTGTAEYRRVVDGSAWRPGATLRAGLDFVFFRRMMITAEMGWTGLSGARYAATSLGQALGLGDATGPVNALAFSARWGWRF